MRLNKQSSISVAGPNRNTPKTAIFTEEEEAILITLLYSDIFSFPLTKDELWKYIISRKKFSRKLFDSSLRFLSPHIVKKDTFYMLKGKDHNIEARIQNKGEVTKKYALAQKAAEILGKIPMIQCIGVSGGLAAKNVKAGDDIDFFIIVKKNSLFVSRFWILIVLETMGLRRSRNKSHASNKICVNLLIDDTNLSWPSAMQNVYTAREIAQLQPIFERDHTYKKFIASNMWVTSYLPNAFSSGFDSRLKSIDTNPFSQLLSISLSLLPFEIMMRYLQKAFMYPHRTTEIVTNHHLAFHPKDYRAETLRQLKLKMRHLGLLTKE